MTNIALVDDESNILISVSLALRTEGFNVDTFKNGEEAIQGLENHDHDANDIWGFDSKVRSAVNSACSVSYGIIMC